MGGAAGGPGRDGGPGHDGRSGVPDAENDQELRLALAMRGGASLAVWIGGAVAEVDRLRCATAEPGDHPWAALAELAGYDRVSVDVLAGASAGGLNGTLLAASIVYGMRFEDMRELWVRLADLEAMSRRVPRFWQRRPPSLLDGDGYFRAELARLIAEQVPPPQRARALGARLDLLLTATLLDPVVEPHFDDRSGALREQRRTAAFAFHHRGEPGDPLSDFGPREQLPETALRMAQAARTTSSFPFAFEPAQVHSGSTPPPGEPDMTGLFSETATGGRPFRVIDGGVLDNIPVTAALRAIAAVPAERPSSRWLLYLNPEPEVGAGRRASRFALPVAATALRARMSQESLLADLEALERHNALAQRTELRRRSLYAPLLAADPAGREEVLLGCARTARTQNAVVRAELDAQAVLRLLTEPAGSEDGRLLPPVPGDPLAGWSPQARTALGTRLSAALGRRAATAPDRVFADVRGLLSAVQQCLDWVRDVERWADRARLPELGACKAALYRLRHFGEVLEGHADRYWIHGARLEPIVAVDELADWAQRVAERRERLQHHLPSPVRPLLGAVLAHVDRADGFQEALAEFAAELASIVDSSGADAAPGDPDGVDAVAEALARLGEIAGRIAAAAPRRGHVELPEQTGYDLLERTGRRDEVLGALVVLTAPLDVGRAPGGRVDFLRVVGEGRTPLPFEALSGDGPPRPEDRVRGGDLGNFGAFLSARWRANDWMWGRLDAAAALAGLLVAPDRLLRHSADRGAEGIFERLREVVTTPSRAELGEAADSAQWRDFLAELWERHAGEVRRELTALFADPAAEHELTAAKAVVTERLHWTIAADELPFAASAPPGAAPGEPAVPPIPEPRQLDAAVRGYDVGRERVADLGEPRLASIALRSALIAYRAVRPAATGVLRVLGRWALTAVKPALLAVVLAIAAPRRVALAGFLGAAAAGLGAMAPSGAAEPLFDLGAGGFTPPAVLAFALAAAAALWFGTRLLRRARGPARWWPAALLAAGMTAAVVGVAATGLRLGPIALVAVSALLTWLVTLAHRPAGRGAATALSALVFGAAVAVLRPGIGSIGWTLPAAVLSAYAQVVLLSTADVLRPRPRPRREDSGSAAAATAGSAARGQPATGR